MYQVLARKCRPQTFDQLVGQKHISRTLGNAIRDDRLAHAYIFAGLRGTGKTSVARILAKCLNCEQGPTTEPCGVCASCAEIGESRSMDVLEVDAASRTGVGDIRELQEVVSYAPARDRFKVLIIDEAHMLSKQAFNALLKTLEEPPPNVLFILATTEPQKLLPTILSRCQLFEFRRVSPRDVTPHLRRICDDEGVRISDEALDRIARAGEGSVRDSLSVLERVLAFCGKEVDDEEVRGILGGVRAEILVEVLSGLARRDAESMLRTLDGIVDEGHDLVQFWGELISALRDVLLIRAVSDAGALLARSPEEAARLAEAAEGLGVEDVNRAFQVLADLEPSLRSTARPRFLFESALVRLAGLGAVRPIEDVLAALGDAPVATQVRTAAPSKKKAPAAVSREPGPVAVPDPGEDLRLALVVALEEKPMLASIVEQALNARVEGDRLRLEFDAPARSMLGPLQRDTGLAMLRDAARKLVGRPVEPKVVVGDDRAKPASAAGTTTTPAQRPQRSTGGKETLLQEATGERGVKKLLREFGAQVVEVRPLDPAPDPDSES